MSNYTTCPNCQERIDATQAALERECPNCPKSFAQLVEIVADDYETPKIEYPIDGPGGSQ